jgi:hypothetical protein
MRDKSGFAVPVVVRLTAAVMLLFACVPVARSEPAQPQNGSNRLTNGDFETFTDGTADGWSSWGQDDGAYSVPAFAPGSPAYSGSNAQKTSWRLEAAGRPMHGGLYQQVNSLTIGHAVSFSLWHNWPDDPQDGTQSVKVWIGIDPYGGTDFNSSAIVWTADDQYATNYYQKLSAMTTVLSSTVTVFTRSKSQYPRAAYVLWDDAVATSGPWQYVHLPLVARNYVPPCTLQNGGFEGDYVDLGSGTRVAPHWLPWWNDNKTKPEYSDTTTLSDPDYRIRSGEKSQQYGANWKTYQSGLYQQLTGCTINNTLRLSAHGLGFAARVMGSRASDPDGNLQMKVGIDPSGGTDFTSDQIQWSEEAVSLDAYRRFEVTATVKSPTVTVFLYSEPLHEPITHWFHNTSYWDDADLEKLP